MIRDIIDHEFEHFICNANLGANNVTIGTSSNCISTS